MLFPKLIYFQGEIHECKFICLYEETQFSHEHLKERLHFLECICVQSCITIQDIISHVFISTLFFLFHWYTCLDLSQHQESYYFCYSGYVI